MTVYLPKNLKFLRRKNGKTQAQLGEELGIGKTTIANYEADVSSPDLARALVMSKHFGVTLDDLISRNLEEEADLEADTRLATEENVGVATDSSKVASPLRPLTVTPTVTATVTATGKTDYQPSNLEPLFITSDDLKAIPIVDISVAAGNGYLNPDRMEVQGYISVPKNLVQRGFHLAVRTKGESMEPTLPDSSLLIIRLLERNEWQAMRDEEIYVVTDREGTSWVKTVKNRLEKYGFLVLMSENPDKAAHPNFNVQNADIHNIWHVDAALQFRFRHVYRQYMDRLSNLEDTVDELRSFMQLPAKNSTRLRR